MFYYGLDFHDLAPDSFLHISTFIVVCEAFLRVTPHFGLWQDVGGNDTYGITRMPTVVSGARGREKSGSNR